MMPLPALISPSSTDFQPLSIGEHIEYRRELKKSMLSFKLRPHVPSSSKDIGRLFSVLGVYEVACLFFEFSDMIARHSESNELALSFFTRKLKPFTDEYFNEKEIIGSFVVISNPSPQDVILIRLMDSMEVAASRREEFKSEFRQLARRYMSQDQNLLAAPTTAANKEQQKSKRQPLDWQAIELPDGLKWPSRSYADAAKLGISIIEHLETEWKDLIAAGIATRHVVESIDKSTLTGIENYRHAKPKKRLEKADRVIPSHLVPLTKKQALDRAILQNPIIALTDPRVARTLGGRAIRANRRRKLLPISLTAESG